MQIRWIVHNNEKYTTPVQGSVKFMKIIYVILKQNSYYPVHDLSDGLRYDK